MAVSGKSLNRAWLSAVWSWKVWSTVKPRSAIRRAGSSASAKLRRPQRPTAVSQVAGEPGTPTDRPLVTASAKGRGLPSSRNSELSAVREAVSRPSMVCTRPVAWS